MSQTSSSSPQNAPRPGRPTTCTVELLKSLEAAVRQTGCSDSAAAQTVGVSTSTLSRWKQGCPDLALRLLQARQQFRTRQLEVIFAAAESGGWRAAAWLLERVFPEEYSPRAKERAQFQALADSQNSGPEVLAQKTDDVPSVPAQPSAPATQPTTTPCSTSVPNSQNYRNSRPSPIAHSEASSHNSQNTHPHLNIQAPQNTHPIILTGPIFAAAA